MSPVVPAGVRTSKLKVPAAGIAVDGSVTVSSVLLTTTAGKVSPLKTTSEEERKCVPTAVTTNGDGSCAKATEVGVIEVRLGTARALPQKGFRALHPAKTRSTTNNELRRPIR